MTIPDNVAVPLLALAGSLPAAVLGASAIRRLRKRSVRMQAVGVAAATLLTTIAGILFAAKQMFLSTHDLGVLFIVIGVSTAVGVGAAIQMGGELAGNVSRVSALAQELGRGNEATSVPAPVAPGFDTLFDDVADLPRRLEELRARAEALESSRRELVAWVSHDLRSPLATIRAMAEALDDGVVDDAATTARYHHQLRRDAERLSALVDDLFELSRIHSGVHEVRRDRVCMSDVVRDAVASQAGRANRLGVTIVHDGDDEVFVDLAAVELGRVVHNVLDNALRHTPAGGRVVIHTRVDDACATLSVDDECGGIPSTDLDRVFDVAFRGDSARSKSEQGGGLGLAIAKGLVEACAGAIDVTNVDQGCRFTVQLPLAQ